MQKKAKQQWQLRKVAEQIIITDQFKRIRTWAIFIVKACLNLMQLQISSEYSIVIFLICIARQHKPLQEKVFSIYYNIYICKQHLINCIQPQIYFWVETDIVREQVVRVVTGSHQLQIQSWNWQHHKPPYMSIGTFHSPASSEFRQSSHGW